MDNNVNKIDYAGRTVDLLLLKTVTSVPTANQRMTLDVSNVKDEPMIVTGIEKMVQRFALLFLTALDSVKFRATQGTNIIPDAANGRIYNDASLEAAAAEANMLARTQMMQADEIASLNGDSTPDDERITDSTVIDLRFSRENASAMISIKLTSAAGNTYTYIIPVAIGVH